MEAHCNKHSKWPHWSVFPPNPCFRAPVEHCTSGALIQFIDKQTTRKPVEHAPLEQESSWMSVLHWCRGSIDALQRSAARLS